MLLRNSCCLTGELPILVSASFAASRIRSAEALRSNFSLWALGNRDISCAFPGENEELPCCLVAGFSIGITVFLQVCNLSYTVRYTCILRVELNGSDLTTVVQRMEIASVALFSFLSEI